jgi:cytochrome d ubiquinol oxidase subunit I
VHLGRVRGHRDLRRVHHGCELVDADPVGYVINPLTKQPQLNDIFAIFTNPVFLWSYIHVLLASLITASLVMLSVSAWQLRRKQNAAFVRPARLAVIVLIPAIILSMFIGSELGVVEGKYQPMKIAAAEAQWNTCTSHCSFSLFQVGGGSNDQTPTQIIQVPSLLSILATNSINGEVKGLNQLQAQYVQEYGPGNYIPNVFIQYWSMRVMAYLALAVLLLGLWAAWLLRRKTMEKSKAFLFIATWAVALPFLINTAGWLLAENGRQPWIVQGLMKTSAGVSPSVSSYEIWISLAIFVLIFAVFAAVDGFLMVKFGRRELDETDDHTDTNDDESADMPALVY